MAHTNATRWGEAAQKKSKSVFALKLTKDLMKSEGAEVKTGNFLIGHLPANSVVTAAYVRITKVSDAATSAKLKLGNTEGGAQIMVDVDIKAAAGILGSVVGRLDTGTGMPLYMALALAGAATTPGIIDVVVEYTEVEKNNGEYTQF